ncbi:MAG: 23S rRNA (guanosine(2251)-2'-O)-methyltransferase RlmB [Candidatus Kapaibacteriales bacterium]
MDNNHYFYGRNPITELLKKPKGSKELPQKIFVSYGAHGTGIDDIIKAARSKSVPVTKYDNRKFGLLEKEIGLEQRASQGVIALMPIGESKEPEELIIDSFEEVNPLLLVLDEIKDVHNLGAIARTAAALGAYGIIVPDRNSAPVNPTTLKISAGTLEFFPVATSKNIKQTIDYMKGEGFTVIGTEMNGTNRYTEDLYDGPTCIVIGSEEKGMRQSVKDKCDKTVSIDISDKVESLNASVAAAIILSEIARQRKI